MTAYPDAHLLARLESTARRHPGRPAVLAPDADLSYADLLSRARGLASRLADRGVRRHGRVGVALVPGAGAVVAACAAGLLGAAYVPVDPAQPERWLRAVLDGAEVDVTVGEDGLDLGERPMIRRGALPPGADRSPVPRDPAGGGPSAHDVAYVVHTSGSTGRPKGIEVEHAGIVNLIDAIERRCPVADGHRGSWWTAPTFDVAMWEMWSPLRSGGTVVVIPPEDRLDASRLAAVLDGAGVHSAYVPPALLVDLRDHLAADATACTGLARLLVGVEPIPLGLLQDLMRLRPGLRVINGYGPAETTVCCTLYDVPAHGGTPTRRTPIGTAVAGNRLHLLDEAGRATDAPVGELLIAGVGVARGYLGPDQGGFTREPGHPEMPAFRTGDLVRRLPDGNLVFEGRVDRQLKVRGYRVEPGEVEAALRAADPALRDVVVAARELAGQDPAIVAYLVAGGRVDVRALRARVARMLPAYAVPTTLVQLDHIPQTAHGKVDYAALAAVAVPAGPPVPGGRAPADGDQMLDAVLAGWRAVLAVDEVDPLASFTQLGGTSLEAVRVTTALRSRTGRAVSAGDVIAAASARELAVRLVRAEVTPPDPAAHGRLDGPLSPHQLGVWMHDRLGPPTPRYTETCCFDIAGPLDPDRLVTAVARVSAAHPGLGAIIGERDGMPWWYLARHDIGLNVRDVDGDMDDASLDALLTKVASEPFDLSRGPLTRCVLLRLRADRHVLLFVWHHLVIDGWSTRVLLGDLAVCYRDPEAPVAAPSVTICDLAVALTEAAAGTAFTSRLRAALAPLEGAPVELVWPAPDGPGNLPARRVVALDADTTRRVARAAAARRVTAPAVLVAAYQHAVREVVGVGDLVLGCATAVRGQPGADRVVGYLTNTVLLRFDDRAAPTPREAVRTGAASMAHAMAVADVPLSSVSGALLRGVGRPRSFPQVYFTVDDAPTLDLPALSCRRRHVELPRGKFDLTLALECGRDAITGTLDADPGVVAAATAERIADAFLDAVDTLTGTVLDEWGPSRRAARTGGSTR